MRKSLAIKSAAAILTSCAVVAGLAGFASVDGDEVNAADAVAAVQQAAPAAVSKLATTTSTEDAAAAAKVDGSTVSIPSDPSAGVSVNAPGADSDVTIGLPFADQAGDATESPKAGVVVFDNNNGSSTVPVVHQDGSVQITTVIENAQAPKRYDYPVTVPNGEALQLWSDGSVFAVSSDGTASVYIATPWAKDANGSPVPTHYELSGNIVTQVVETNAETAFPVVADPSISFGVYITITMSQASAQAIHAGSAATAVAILSVLGTPLLGIIAAGVYGALSGYNGTKLAACRNVAFKFTYLGQLASVGCV